MCIISFVKFGTVVIEINVQISRPHATSSSGKGTTDYQKAKLSGKM